jgi:maltose alpha-D-glucosyltransferase/alpha-amylase
LPKGRFGPLAVNAEEQRRDSSSLLNWMERMIRRRRETPELGRGDFEVLESGASAVLAHRVDGDARTLVFVHNLSPEPCQITLPVGRLEEEGEDGPTGLVVTDLLDNVEGLVLDRRRRLALTLEGYAAKWFSIEQPGVQRSP